MIAAFVQGEARLAADWVGQRFAWKLEATVVADPDDDQTVRPDGSYVAMSLGNWIVSAGYLERWWGPGWQGSLFIGALRGQALVRLTLDGDRITGEERLFSNEAMRVRDVRQGPDGFIYLLTDARNGELLRLLPR